MAAFKKFCESDVFETYRSAYSLQLPWTQCISADLAEWFEIFEKGTNCSRSLAFPCMLALTSSLVGPDTHLRIDSTGFKTVLNQYLIAVCDPGGGKTNTYDHVVLPTLETLSSQGKQIQLESYTTAGIQKHQIESSGYGLITGDEGHRFLSSITQKQLKGEAERSLLCKMWGGKGDQSILSTGSRGFSKTSMSICLMIQPHPLLSELLNLNGEDGLIDRFLFFVAKPEFYPSRIVQENFASLNQSHMKSFEPVFMSIYNEHQNANRCYRLSRAAEKEYINMVDQYAELISKKYDIDNDSDKENSFTQIQFTQDSSDDNVSLTTPKDTQHIIKLAVTIHILEHAWKTALHGLQETPTPTEIQIESMERAKLIFNTINQQKSIFIQAIKSVPATPVPLKKCQPFRSRVIKCVCRSHGPIVSIRKLQKHIKGSLVTNIKIELEKLEREGFGSIKDIKMRGTTRTIFMKIPAQIIDGELRNHSDILKTANINIENYSSNFNNIQQLEDDLRQICQQHHPYVNDFIEIFNRSN